MLFSTCRDHLFNLKGTFSTTFRFPSFVSYNLLSSTEVKETYTRPTNAQSTSLNIERYAGTYTSPGYRPMSLCHARSNSTYCRDVLTTMASLGQPTDLDGGLYGAYESVWATHVRLEHFAGDVFNITLTAILPHGFGRNTSAFELYETGTSGGWVEFAVGADAGEVEGFAFFTDAPACAARARKTGGGSREAADAWFERV